MPCIFQSAKAPRHPHRLSCEEVLVDRVPPLPERQHLRLSSTVQSTAPTTSTITKGSVAKDGVAWRVSGPARPSETFGGDVKHLDPEPIVLQVAVCKPRRPQCDSSNGTDPLHSTKFGTGVGLCGLVRERKTFVAGSETSSPYASSTAGQRSLYTAATIGQDSEAGILACHHRRN